MRRLLCRQKHADGSNRITVMTGEATMLYLAERSEVVDNLRTMCPSLIRETMSSKEIAKVFYRIVKHCIWCPIGDGDTTYVFKSWKFWCAVARCAFANMDDYVNAESILLGAAFRDQLSKLHL